MTLKLLFRLSLYARWQQTSFGSSVIGGLNQQFSNKTELTICSKGSHLDVFPAGRARLWELGLAGSLKKIHLLRAAVVSLPS